MSSRVSGLLFTGMHSFFSMGRSLTAVLGLGCEVLFDQAKEVYDAAVNSLKEGKKALGYAAHAHRRCIHTHYTHTNAHYIYTHLVGAMYDALHNHRHRRTALTLHASTQAAKDAARKEEEARTTMGPFPTLTRSLEP